MRLSQAKFSYLVHPLRRKGDTMICLRCGYCCIHYEVIIVNDPALGIREDNLVPKHTGDRCPHLRGNEKGKFSCALHGYRYYRRTPCYEYTQIEHKSTPCRWGIKWMKMNIV